MYPYAPPMYILHIPLVLRLRRRPLTTRNWPVPEGTGRIAYLGSRSIMSGYVHVP